MSILNFFPRKDRKDTALMSTPSEPVYNTVSDTNHQRGSFNTTGPTGPTVPTGRILAGKFKKKTKQIKLLQMRSHWQNHPEDVERMLCWSSRNIFPPQKKSSETLTIAKNRAQKDEFIFGNDIIRITRTGTNDNTCNWTTIAVESFVEFILHSLYGDVTRPHYNCHTMNVRPDFETTLGIWEVKARTWNIAGTVGEKIFAIPWKYGALAETLDKPIIILLVAKQEQEMRDKYGMFGGNISEFHSKQLQSWSSQNIHFVPFTRLIRHYNKKKTHNIIS